MLASEGLSFRTRIARSIFWLAWSRGVLQVLSFATTLLVARMLVPADYGVMAVAGILTGSVAILVEMGLGAAIIQFRDLDKREIDTCFWITMILAIVGWAALSLGASSLARWFEVPRLADVLIIGKITGQVTLGLYSMARELALLPGSKISTVVNMLSSPVMAELQTNLGAMRWALYRAVRLTTAIALPTSAGMALVAEEMVSVLLGPKWLPAAPIFCLLCVYAAVRSIDALLPPVLMARRRERFLFWYCFALLIVVPVAAVVGAMRYGAPGAIVLAKGDTNVRCRRGRRHRRGPGVHV